MAVSLALETPSKKPADPDFFAGNIWAWRFLSSLLLYFSSHEEYLCVFIYVVLSYSQPSFETSASLCFLSSSLSLSRVKYVDHAKSQITFDNFQSPTVGWQRLHLIVTSTACRMIMRVRSKHKENAANMKRSRHCRGSEGFHLW